MKKRTSNLSRRIVSLLMSIVLTLTLVTPAAFATEVVDNSGTTIVEGGAGTTGTTPSGDAGNGGSGDVSTPAGGKDSEDKNTEDANKPDEDKKGEENPDGDKKDEAPDEDKKDEENKDEQPAEEIDTLEDEGENAVDAVTVWDGSTATQFADGTGTESDPYQISTGAELAWLAAQVNAGTNYSGEYFTLTSDIQLNELDENGMPKAAEGQTGPYQWTPIGVYVDGRKNDKPFSGTFDGNGHTISGLYINSMMANGQGLFAVLGAGGTVQNLIVTGTVHTPYGDVVGGIAAKSSGKVWNCGFYGDVRADTWLSTSAAW